MSQLPLVEGVLKYLKENNRLFCTPGHRGGNGFNTPVGMELIKNLANCDLTEVEGLDNLQHPDGIIKDSGNLLSRYYCSKKSYFLVNGSTSGNLAMLFAAFNEGDKIIVERNCHKSIFNGILIRKLRPIYIKNKIDKNFNAPLSIDIDHFNKIIEENKDAKGILITYPNYYGVCSNLKEIISRAKFYNMTVLVDSAHGAHFGSYEGLPESAVKLGANAAVMSAHKTLCSFTQSAYLHINDGIDMEKIEFYINLFSSTSPSYLLLCSMDYARFHLETYGKSDYKKLLDRINGYRVKINEIKHLKVLDDRIIDDNISAVDLSRLVINLEEPYSAYKFLNYLREMKIQAEMSDGNNVVLIFTPFNEESDLESLYNAIIHCDFSKIINESYSKILICDFPKQAYNSYEVLEMNKSYIEIDKALDYICGENIIPYPPGIPIIMMGEIIDKSVISMVKYYIDNNSDILGVKDGKIKVIKMDGR